MTRTKQRRPWVRTAILAAALVIVAFLILGKVRFGLFGGGKKLGGTGGGSAPSQSPTQSPSPTSQPAEKRCDLRLDSQGLALAGRTVTSAEAIAACRDAKLVTIRVVGDTPFGRYDEIRAAFAAAGIPLVTR